MKIKCLFTIVFYTLCLPAYADYRGIIVAHVVEPNGHVYRAYDGFDSGGIFKREQVIYFGQERGQKISLVNKNIFIDKSTAHKYHLVFAIRDKTDEEFEAEIKFYRNKMTYDSKTEKYSVNSTLIKKASITGILNSENKYVFVDDNLSNFRLRLNIDKIFDKDELLVRFKALL